MTELWSLLACGMVTGCASYSTASKNTCIESLGKSIKHIDLKQV